MSTKEVELSEKNYNDLQLLARTIVDNHLYLISGEITTHAKSLAGQRWDEKVNKEANIISLYLQEQVYRKLSHAGKSGTAKG